MIKKTLRAFTVTLTAIFAFAYIATAQTTSPSTNFPGISIGNFGQMDDNFYRGAQPEPDDFKSLADIGIKTIIDLRNDPTDYEKAAAEAVGIKYVNIPLSGWKKPDTEDIQKFLAVTNDPATGKFYVHCKAGIHRTGMTGAIYRMTKYGWDYDQAYQEMKNYHFTSGLVHGGLKSYVKSYAKRLDEQRSLAAKEASAPAAAGALTSGAQVQ